jgi:hypothetical protein
MADLLERIISAMSSLEFIGRNYPMLTEWGVLDQDVLIHSLGCSVWNLLGHDLGFIAVAECPAPMTHGLDIRADSTWFCRMKRKPVVLIEFERFDGSRQGQQKLDEKIRNLLEAAMRWENSPSVLILSAWSKGVVSAPDLHGLKERCRDGFRTSTGVNVVFGKNTTLLFNRFIFEIQSDRSLIITQTRSMRLL